MTKEQYNKYRIPLIYKSNLIMLGVIILLVVAFCTFTIEIGWVMNMIIMYDITTSYFQQKHISPIKYKIIKYSFPFMIIYATVCLIISSSFVSTSVCILWYSYAILCFIMFDNKYKIRKLESEYYIALHLEHVNKMPSSKKLHKAIRGDTKLYMLSLHVYNELKEFDINSKMVEDVINSECSILSKYDSNYTPYEIVLLVGDIHTDATANMYLKKVYLGELK